ncbi:MAG: nucleotidyltransferase family protein [Pseudomonadota bacterium]|nr:nucleotidyltransferase family protein [Pseudomonadota bacterium]
MAGPVGIDRCAVILAGGLGTRLRAAVPDMPKVLAPVAGRPFLEHVLAYLERNEFTYIVLAVGYRSSDILNTFGERFGKMTLAYSVEDRPLGTGGALWRAAQLLPAGKDFFVLNGDTFAEVDFRQMENALTEKGTDLVLAVRPMPDTGRYGRVEADAGHRVIGFREKEVGRAGVINAGTYLMRSDLPRRLSFPEAFSLEVDLLQSKCGSLQMRAAPTSGTFIDIGIPADYEKANREFSETIAP